MARKHRAVEGLAMIDSFAGFYRGKHVLVTGHTGFKGAWLCHWLLELGARVTGFSNAIPVGPSLFSATGLADRVEHRIGDVTNLAQVAGVLAEQRPEVIFHLAAQPLVSESYADPLGTMQTNAMGTANLLEAIRLRPWAELAGVILVTTDKVYGDRHGDRALRETDSFGSADPYSSSKAMAEIVIATYARLLASAEKTRHLRLASVRAGNVFGGGDWSRNRLIPDCANAILARQPIRLRCPHSIRPWQYVLEPLAGYLQLLARLLSDPTVPNGEGWNFGPRVPENITAESIARQLLHHTGHPADYRIECEPASWNEAPYLLLDSGKAKTLVGWETVLSIDEGLQRTLRFYETVRADCAQETARALVREQILDYSALARQRGQIWTTSAAALAR